MFGSFDPFSADVFSSGPKTLFGAPFAPELSAAEKLERQVIRDLHSLTKSWRALHEMRCVKHARKEVCEAPLALAAAMAIEAGATIDEQIGERFARRMKETQAILAANAASHGKSPLAESLEKLRKALSTDRGECNCAVCVAEREKQKAAAAATPPPVPPTSGL